LLLNENKLKNLIKKVIQEMAHSYGGIHYVGGDINQKYDIQPHERNRTMTNIPNEKFSKQLDWRLKNYQGCNIHTFMFPSNLATKAILVDKQIINRFDRFIDITDNIEEIISILSEALDIYNPSVQKLFNTLRQSTDLAADDANGVLIYLGSHTETDTDPPTPFNMLHQIVDSASFEDISFSFDEIYQKIKRITTSDGTNALAAGVFEGKAQAVSQATDVIFNQIIMALGWLDPDTCTIISTNPTNSDLIGSSNPYDIVKRCLAPKYKNDSAFINKLISINFEKLLCQCVKDFWDIFRGRVILTFSGQE